MWHPRFRAKFGTESEESDEQLLPALGRGDEQAFLTIYRRHQASIFRYAIHLGGDEEVAAEVVQETFLALLRAAGQLDPSKGTILSWLFSVARNQVLRQLRSRSRHLSLDDEDEREPVAPESVLLDLEQQQLHGRLRETLATLPPLYREVLVLCDIQELSYEQVAAIIGRPTGTVRSRLHRARTLLAGKLRPQMRYAT